MTFLFTLLTELNYQTKEKKKFFQLDFFMPKMITLKTLIMEKEQISQKKNTKIVIIKNGKEFFPSPLTPMSN